MDKSNSVQELHCANQLLSYFLGKVFSQMPTSNFSQPKWHRQNAGAGKFIDQTEVWPVEPLLYEIILWGLNLQASNKTFPLDLLWKFQGNDQF